MGLDLVLWRSREGCTAGAICAFIAARGSRWEPIRRRFGLRRCLVCPYHAWEYAPSGECVRIPAHPELTPPAKARAETFAGARALRRGVGCAGRAAGPLPEFPLADDPDSAPSWPGLTGFARWGRG
jgi:nitrite reductase/ring-hydroxylating ferredoxin subunit